MTLQEFFKWYEPYLQTQKLPTDTCPILHLQKQMENTLYNW